MCFSLVFGRGGIIAATYTSKCNICAISLICVLLFGHGFDSHKGNVTSDVSALHAILGP